MLGIYSGSSNADQLYIMYKYDHHPGMVSGHGELNEGVKQGVTVFAAFSIISAAGSHLCS